MAGLWVPPFRGGGRERQRHFGCAFLHISTYAVSSELRLGGGSTFIFALGPETSSNGRLHMRLGYEPTQNSLSTFRANHYTIRKHNIGWRGECNLQMGWHTCSACYLSVPCVQYLQHILVQCNTLRSWRYWRMYSVIGASRIKAEVHLFDNRWRRVQTASDRSSIFHSKDVSTVAKSAYYLSVMTVYPSVYPRH